VPSPLIELDTFLPYRISVLANVMSSAIAAAYDERFGLSIPEWRVIAVLSRYPGLSAREVAHKTRMDAVAVSRAVNRLLRAGRLRRAIAPDDRRRSVLHVSAAGAMVYREVAPLALEIERALIEVLPAADRETLDRVIGTLTERADALSKTLRTNGPVRPARRKRRPASPRRRASR
jgi:DNA-binding MarR family transcriptional regulator